MIEVSDITKAYGAGGNKNQVLKGISLQIADGDFTVLKVLCWNNRKKDIGGHRRRNHMLLAGQ